MTAFTRSITTITVGTGSVCMSDYTGARTGFNFAVNSGWNARLSNVWADWPNFVNGGTPAELVPTPARTYLTAVSAPRACPGGCTGVHHDVALFEVNFDTRTVAGGPFWLTSSAGWEKFPHLPRYGANSLVGWTTVDQATSDFSSPTHWWLAEVTAASARAAPPSTSCASTGEGSQGWRPLRRVWRALRLSASQRPFRLTRWELPCQPR